MSLISRIERLEYPSTILWRGIEISLLKQQLKKITIGPNILDLGCGEGFIADAVFETKISCGIDIDPGMILLATKNQSYQQTLCVDATKNIPLESGSFDTIISNSVLEHIPNLEGVLFQVERLLTKNGLFIFTVPNDRLVNYSLAHKLFGSYIGTRYTLWRNKKFDHFHTDSVTTWELFLAKHNLELVNQFSYLSKSEIELWDLLLWLYRLIPSYLRQWVYIRFHQKRIMSLIQSATSTNVGAATCFVARKT